jgi:hypothetical protein
MKFLNIGPESEELEFALDLLKGGLAKRWTGPSDQNFSKLVPGPLLL